MARHGPARVPRAASVGGIAEGRDEAAEQGDEADEAGASDGASQLIPGVRPTMEERTRTDETRPTRRSWLFLSLLASFSIAACRPLDLEMPPVKTPVRLRLACQPPRLLAFRAAPPIGSSCGLPDLGCDDRRPLVVEVDERAQVTAAFIPGVRSPELDACILAEVRQNGWDFSIRLANATASPWAVHTLRRRASSADTWRRVRRAAEQGVSGLLPSKRDRKS